MVSKTLSDLFAVTSLLQGFSHSRQLQPGVMFVPGRAEKDDLELLYAAAAWLGVGGTDRYLVFPGHDGSYANGERVKTGYAGFDSWKEWIARCNLPADRVLPCVVRPGQEHITHTREETDGFILRAQEHCWRSAVALAFPHQLPRVMGCLLKSMEELQYSLDILPRAPDQIQWHRPVYGSLGQTLKARWCHTDEELERILKYQENGWMSSLAQVRDYLLRLHGPEPAL